MKIEFNIENLKLIKKREVKRNIEYLLKDMYNQFAYNQMTGGMIINFFEDCLNGSILIALKRNERGKFYNELNQFYIDDRVGFKGVKKVLEIREQISKELLKIVKYDKPLINVGDIVKPKKDTCNVALKEKLIIFPNIKFKVCKIIKGLNPSYFGYYIVTDDLKPYKKNYIYAGSDDLILVKEVKNER